MASADKKQAANVPGRFFVDKECIDCDVCRLESPDFFTRHDDGYSFVYKQPTSPEEIKKVQDTIYSCPVEAIGDLGEEAQGEAHP